MTKKEKEAFGWLSALDIKSEYEASNKETLLNLIEKQEEIIKNACYIIKLNKQFEDLNNNELKEYLYGFNKCAIKK